MDLIVSIENEEYLNVIHNEKNYFGGNQSWFPESNAQYGGCGAVCAFNILRYIEATYKEKAKSTAVLLDGQTELEKMQVAYTFMKPMVIEPFLPKTWIQKKKIPPTLGIPSMSYFKRRFLKRFNKGKGQILSYEVKAIKLKSSTKKESLEFIEQQLNANHPIALFNSFSGGTLWVLEKNQELKPQRFITHWVTVTGLYSGKLHDEKGEERFILKCSTWGQVAYFYYDELFEEKNRIINKLIPSGMLAFYPFNNSISF